MQIKQATEIEFETTGALSNPIVDGPSLADEAWGDRANGEDSGLIAMAYLWRRFGPPWWGADSHKKLVSYILTTHDPDIFLEMNLSGSALRSSAAHLMSRTLYEEAMQPYAAPEPCPTWPDLDNWREVGGIVTRVNQALFDAMKELERPVYVRDVAINIFGRCDDTDTPAEYSKYAGYGIPQHAMDDWIGQHG